MNENQIRAFREGIEELKRKLEDLQYRLDLIYYSTKYHRPSCSVFYELGFTKEKEQELYDILEYFMNKVENNEKFSFREIEDALSRIGIGYQSLKSIFIALWEECRYTPVIVAYLKDIAKYHGSVASEYNEIWKEIKEKGL